MSATQIADMRIRLSADKATFDRDVKQAQDQLRGFTAQAKAANDANYRMGSGLTYSSAAFTRHGATIAAGARVAAGGLGMIVGAGAAAVAAINSVAGAQAAQAQEWSNLANRAGETVATMQAMAYATDTVGVNADKAADIIKDFRDKLGDFIATGGGEFADFFEKVAPKVGLTAQKLQQMSGPDALIAVKQAMDAANVSAEEQVFYLESIADEATALLPLLEEQGEKLRELTDRHRQLNGVMTQSEMTRLKEYRQDVNDMSLAWDALVREAVMPFVDELAEGARWFAEIFSQGRRNLLAERIHDTHSQVVELKQEIAGLEDPGTKKFGGVGLIDALLGNTDNADNLKRKKAQLAELKAELGDYQERYAVLQGKPDDNRSDTFRRPFTPPAGSGNGATSGLAQQQAAGAKQLAQLDAQYATELERMRLAHEQRLTELENLQLGEAELRRRGFESIEQLRAEYKEREREYHEQEREDYQQRREEELQRAIEAEQRKQDAISQEQEAALARRKQAEENAQSQLLSMQMSAAGTAVGMMKQSAAEGSAVWVAATIAQRGLMAAQAFMHANLAAAQTMTAMIIPGNPASVVAATAMAEKMRLMGYINAGLIAGQGLMEVAGARANGGQVIGSRAYLVGERGPELFVPGETGQITSHENLQKAVGGSGGAPMAFNLYYYEDGDRESGDAPEFVKMLFGRLRGVVQEELHNQMRAGGILNRG